MLYLQIGLAYIKMLLVDAEAVMSPIAKACFWVSISLSARIELVKHVCCKFFFVYDIYHWQEKLVNNSPEDALLAQLQNGHEPEVPLAVILQVTCLWLLQFLIFSYYFTSLWPAQQIILPLWFSLDTCSISWGLWMRIVLGRNWNCYHQYPKEHLTEKELLESWRWETTDGDDLAERKKILSRAKEIVFELIDSEVTFLNILYIMYKFKPYFHSAVSSSSC